MPPAGHSPAAARGAPADSPARPRARTQDGPWWRRVVATVLVLDVAVQVVGRGGRDLAARQGAQPAGRRRTHGRCARWARRPAARTRPMTSRTFVGVARPVAVRPGGRWPTSSTTACGARRAGHGGAGRCGDGRSESSSRGPVLPCTHAQWSSPLPAGGSAGGARCWGPLGSPPVARPCAASWGSARSAGTAPARRSPRPHRSRRSAQEGRGDHGGERDVKTARLRVPSWRSCAPPAPPPSCAQRPAHAHEHHTAGVGPLVAQVLQVALHRAGRAAPRDAQRMAPV